MRVIGGVLGVVVVLFAFIWALFLLLLPELNVILGVVGAVATLLAGVLFLLYAMTEDREVAQAGALCGVVALALVCVQALMG